MKPSIPKGTRDFSPQEMVKRNYIFDIIRKVYQLHGYQPIETPATENMETLMGKYGSEGDRLIFKIYDSGNVLDGLEPNELNDLINSAIEAAEKEEGITYSNIIQDSEESQHRVRKFISDFINSKLGKALRYDLTVPFARYVVQHRNDITFPFKRYQIQPVWRADRPQKGRYREFYQCDADVIGSDSLLNEVELIQIIDEVFTQLGVPVIIKLNNRKILQGIAESIGAPDRIIEIATLIDKIDKFGNESIKIEFREKGFSEEQIEKLDKYGIFKAQEELTDPDKHPFEVWDFFSNMKENTFNEITVFQKGIKELEYIFEKWNPINRMVRLELDIALARGLNYYTGTIIEVKVDTSKCNSQFTSSICGGGRYDDLTGIFGLPDVSGVGISFGADRIYDVMEELKLFPENVSASTKVLLINFGDKEAQYCLKVLKDLHTAGISAELYPDAKKLNKQFEYADKRNIPNVVTIGQSEMERGVAKIKNMASGEQQEVYINELVNIIKSDKL